MNGRLISVCVVDESSILAFSAASLSRCSASLSCQIDALFFLELVGEIAHQAHVEIFAAEERIAVGGFDLEHAVANFENRNIERATAQIVDRDRARGAFFKPVGERSRGRFVDDAQHFEAGDLTGVFGGLPLGVVEVGGNRDDRLIHLLPEMASASLSFCRMKAKFEGE
jgi:hypothetical protein